MSRLAIVVQNFWDESVHDIFGDVEDGKLFARVDKVCLDPDFWHWVLALSAPLQIVDGGRKWGSWCPCHELDENWRKVECPRKSRRLHEASAYLKGMMASIASHRNDLSLASVGGSHGALDASLRFCNLILMIVPLKFAWLDELPYLFANMDQVDGAAKVVEHWERAPATQHHSVTWRLMDGVG